MTTHVTPAAGRPTVPWSWYSDPSILARETDRIFRRAWQYAAHLGELPGPGSYVASATGPVPVVLTHDGDGVLRGFVNVCRHRGAILATGAERRGTLQCPYHAWTYGLDGCLRAAPRSGEDANFDAAAQNHLWFPTLKFNVLPGHPNLSLGPLWPTGPDTCAGYLDYWFGQTADARWIEELFVLDNQIGAEDTALVEAAQRGSAGGGIEHGWVLGGPENLIGHFQDYVRGQLGETA